MLLRFPIALTALLSLAAVVMAAPADAENKADINLTPITIPTYIFTIYNHPGHGRVIPPQKGYEGYVFPSQIDDQMKALNSAFTGTGLGFELKGVFGVLKSEWYFLTPGSPEETNMKRHLRKGGPETLNIYIIDLSPKFTSAAPYPWQYNLTSALHGILLDINSIPGGNNHYHHKGLALVKAVGNSYGLPNTWEGGCSKAGSLPVSDTPPEARPASGCPKKNPNTCGGNNDPIHNFMDSTSDDCKDSFTPGQIKRMMEWAVRRMIAIHV